MVVSRINNPTGGTFAITVCKLRVPVVILSAENDSTFTNVNRLFVLSFENENNRNSFSKYYVPSIEIKDFTALIDGNHSLKFL